MKVTIKANSHVLVVMLFAMCISMQYQSSAYAEDEKNETDVLDFLPAFLATFGAVKLIPHEICKTGSPYDVICNSGQKNYFVVFIDEDKEEFGTSFITPDGSRLSKEDCSADSVTSFKPPVGELPPELAEAVKNPPPGKKAIFRALVITGARAGPTIVPVRLRVLCRAVSTAPQ